MFLTNQDIRDLIAFRRDLHRHPEVSGDEAQTAARVIGALGDGPDQIIAQLGGHGVAAVFNGAAAGPTLLIRAELDALPIVETNKFAHASATTGVAHLCGHDGHSTILTALARGLARQRPARGRVILMFQPAEETGAGARAVLADPAFAPLRPDMAISLHNMPRMPLGHVALQAGPFACASRGMKITLTGAPTHAAQPEFGRSPMQALARLMPALAALAPAGAPLGDGFRLVTITHANMGAPAYGIAPGTAEVRATLRTLRDTDMADLVAQAQQLAEEIARDAALSLDIAYEDVFAATGNAPEATALLDRAVATCGLSRHDGALPIRASEDFGEFGALCPAAMLLLGAGADAPQLHNEDYDFPDDLIAIGAQIFMTAVRAYLG